MALALSRTPAPDEAALVERNIGLVYWVVRKHPEDELIAAGMEGLLSAVRAFDPDRGFQFSTYAFGSIVNRVTNYDRAWNGRETGAKGQARRRATVVSLDEHLAGDDTAVRSDLLADDHPGPEPVALDGLALVELEEILAALTDDDRQRRAFRWLAEGHRKSWIACELGVSQGLVTHWLNRWKKSAALRAALTA